MPASNIIVDSCSYFRLAQSIRPLLKTPFGKENHCLGVIEELEEEYEENPVLKHKFFWVNQKEYADERKHCFALTTNERSQINHAFFFIREFARESQFSVSKVDIIAVSYAYVLKFPIVTDDSDMLEVSKEFEVKTYKTLELLKLMMDSGIVTIAQIRSIVSYWTYQKDTPGSYRRDFKRIFAEEPPK